MTRNLVRSLRRVTSNGRYVPEIDGLRFVAIVSVAFFHVLMLSMIANPTAPKIWNPSWPVFAFISHGDRGVDLFFAISGMVLGLPFARQRLLGHPPVRLKEYFMRRVTRLEPPYIANLLIRLPLVVFIGKLSFGQALKHLAVSMLYADWIVFARMPAIHPPSWSLAIEVQFYLLAPFVAVALFHRSVVLRRTLSIGLILLFSAISTHLPGLPLLTAPRLSLLNFAQFFLVGMLAADFYLTVQSRLRPSWLWDAAALPLWIVFFAIDGNAANYVMPACLIVLIPSAFLGKLSSRFFRIEAVSVIGGMCYSIYLTHSLVLQACFVLVTRLSGRLGFWQTYALGAIIGLPIILVVGTIFFVLIERPCMDKNVHHKAAAWLRARFRRNAAAA